MKISIVMTTYNGEKYLTEQLDSLRTQTRLPDEVIISDDCSADNTNVMIEEYIKKYRLTSWKHIKLKKNVGWKKNFINCIKQANGDLIFTCDQDDIWYPEKLEVMESIMKARPEINLLAGDTELEFKNEPMKRDMKLVEKYPFNEKFMFVYRPGCVFCFRKSFFDTINDYWFEGYPHDALLWRFAELTDSLYLYHCPVIYYRRHDATATGRSKSSRKVKISSMHYYLKAIQQMKAYCTKHSISDFENKKKMIQKAQKWCELRLQLMEKRKISIWIELRQYLPYYYNNKSYFADLLMSMNKKV